MKFLTTIIGNAIIFIAIAGFFPTAFYVSSIWVAVGAALVLAILNVLVKPVIKLLSLPINILTLGLFSLVINGFMLELTSFFVGSGFSFSSFGVAMLVAIAMSIIDIVINMAGTKD